VAHLKYAITVLAVILAGLVIRQALAEVLAPGQSAVLRTPSEPVGQLAAAGKAVASGNQADAARAVARAQQPPAAAGQPLGQSSHVVKLSADGTLTGKIGRLNPNSLQFEGVADVDVHFIQQGRVIARATSGLHGSFTVEGLTPDGVYSVISTGADGLSVISVQVVSSTVQGAAETLSMNAAMVPWQDLQAEFKSKPVSV